MASLTKGRFAALLDEFQASRGVVLPQMAKVSRLAMDGHSFADYEDGSVGGQTGRRRQNRGVGGWLQLLSGGTIEVPLSRDFGIGGQTSTQIAARVAATVAGAADCAGFLVLGSLQINDRGGANLTLAESIASTQTYFDGLVAAGKPVFYTLSTPRDASTMPGIDAYGASQTANFLAYQDWERGALPARYGRKIAFADVFEQMVDPASNPRVSPIGGIAGGGRSPTIDGIHFSPSGAKPTAEKLLPLVQSALPTSLVVDPITAMLAGRTNLVANPTLAGTGGTSSGSGTLSGTIPSNVTCTRPSNHAVIAAAQQVTSTGTWFEIADTYSGVAISSGPEVVFPIGAIADGDTIQWGVEVEFDVPTGAVTEFFAGLRIGTSGTSFISGEGYKTSDVDFLPLSPYRGILFCEPVTIAGLGASTPNFLLRTSFGAANGSVKFRCRRPTLVKV